MVHTPVSPGSMEHSPRDRQTTSSDPHNSGLRNTEHERPDPTKMKNQPALQTSSGRIWIVMGGLFLVASLIPLAALVFVRQGPSMPLATVIGAGVIGLYLAMIGARFAMKPGPIRLRMMATLMIAMAALALFGLLACVYLEQQAVSAVSAIT